MPRPMLVCLGRSQLHSSTHLSTACARSNQSQIQSLAKLFVHVALPFTVAKIAFLLATFCIQRIAATALVRFSKRGCCPIGFKTEGTKTNLLNRSKQRKRRKRKKAPHDALPAGASLLPLLPPFPPVKAAFLSVLCGLAVWDSIRATRRLKIRPLWSRP
jgi:hypothetical protein